MKVTVLGHQGFIGSHIVKEIKEKGYELYLPERDENLSGKALGNVIYCIGLTADFRQKPMQTVKAHVCKLMEVLENCSYDSFLYLSSSRVYNGCNNSEEDRSFSVNPNDSSDLYNISKLMGESVCLSVPNKKIRIARLSNVTGNDFNSDNFLFSLIKDAVDKKKIDIASPPDDKKDYILIEDAIKLLLRIALEGKNKIYNVSSGQSISNKQIVQEIQKHTDCQINFLNTNQSMSAPEIQNNKIKTEFGYTPVSILPEIKILIGNYIKNKKS